MATSMAQLSPSLDLTAWQTFSQLPQYGTLDDFAAMAVLAALSLLYLSKGILWSRPDPYLYKLYERPQEHLAGQSATQSTRDIAQKLEQINGDVVVFWGSQSGTAEKLANRLCKEIRQRFGKVALAADMSDYDSASIANIPNTTLAIFVVSTYGEGEPSDNLNDLWHWLGSTSRVSLSQLKYAAFGLGNSNYKYYNAVVDHVTARLEDFGAHEVLQTGKADDSQGQTEEHYLDWKSALFAMLKTTFNYEEHDPVYEPAIKVEEDVTGESSEIYNGKPWSPSHSRTNRTVSPTYALPIKAANELFKVTKDRNCIHMEVDLSEHVGLKYKTGDHLGISPTNPAPEIERLLRCLGREDSKQVTIKTTQLEQDSRSKTPEYTTLEDLLTHYLEVCAPITREEIGSLVQFAPTLQAKELLVRLSTNKTAYEELLSNTYINIGRLLELAAPEAGAWKNLPLSFIIELLPAMRPRYYSISSSSFQVCLSPKAFPTAFETSRAMVAEPQM